MLLPRQRVRSRDRGADLPAGNRTHQDVPGAGTRRRDLRRCRTRRGARGATSAAGPRDRVMLSGANRPSALSGSGMVSSSHPAASFAGARVLAEGGNAIDATLAMAAVTWLTLPGQCGIGGDAFVIVREPDGEVWTLNGSGYGPDGGTAEFYREQGLRSIPLDGPLAVAVPGAPEAYAAMHARGATRGARRTLGAGRAARGDRSAVLGQDRRRRAQRPSRAIQADAGLRDVYGWPHTCRQPAPPDRPRPHHPLPRRRPAQLLHR